jgi:uncharacterized protein YyaL (SSP411 family)
MNRLQNESSPYLLQHRDNPVDWYPWGPEALELAKRTDRPILLSVGYAACHWCHVMAHESFEDEETARVMNELFVNIKVDREERPDIDAVYMQAVQAMTGSGGWPMTVFLTPAGVPFYGGTYYPREERYGMPAFKRVLTAVAEAYRERRAGVEETGEKLREMVYEAALPRAGGAVTAQTLHLAYRNLAAQFDERNAGFGGAPKFPPSMTLEFLLAYSRRTGTEQALDMVRRTFLAMARGGIYDQIGGGLHRYSVDERWLVPHFEKMLYDNALLVRLGVHLYQATGDSEVRRVTEETIEWLAREMTSASGGFYSSLDADSEGHEGKFYVWTVDELREALGDDAPVAISYWGASREGNFEGTNILYVPDGARVVAARLGVTEVEVRATIARVRDRLFEVRARRVRPGLDDKVIAAWNGLMLRGVAEAARVFGHEHHRELAVGNAEFLWRELVRDGRVHRTHKDGVTKEVGFLEDHAAVALGFLDVYACTFDRVWVERAVELAGTMVDRFYDREARVFYDTPHDHEALITRPRDLTDNATPAGQSLAADLLLRAAEYTGNDGYREIAERVVGESAELLARHATAFGHALTTADMMVHGAVELVVASDGQPAEGTSLARAAASVFVPSLVLAGGTDDALAALAIGAGKTAVGGSPTGYVCRRYTCDAPTQQADELTKQLAKAILPGS